MTMVRLTGESFSLLVLQRIRCSGLMDHSLNLSVKVTTTLVRFKQLIIA